MNTSVVMSYRKNVIINFKMLHDLLIYTTKSVWFHL